MALALRQEMTIRSGPSKWNLMLAFFDGDELHRRTVTFTAFFSEYPEGEPRRDTDVTFEIVINRLERYGTSGMKQFHEWFFEGGVTKVDGSPFAYRVSGCFDTSSRSGHLCLDEATTLWFVGCLEDAQEGRAEAFSAPSLEAARDDQRFCYIYGPYASRKKAKENMQGFIDVTP